MNNFIRAGAAALGLLAFAVIGLRTPGVTILDPGCTSKTFPEYFDVLEELRKAQG